MSYRPRYTSGDWKAICDICGRLFKASVLRKRWDGFQVCPNDFEIRQPQDFVRGVVDKQTTPWVRDEATDFFITSKIGAGDTVTNGSGGGSGPNGGVDTTLYPGNIGNVGGFCTLYSVQGIADVGGADCAQADVNKQLFPGAYSHDATGIAGYAVATVATPSTRYILT